MDIDPGHSVNYANSWVSLSALADSFAGAYGLTHLAPIVLGDAAASLRPDGAGGR